MTNLQKQRDLVKSLRADLAQATTLGVTIKADFDRFRDALATKVSSISDTNEILAAIDRLLVVEDQLGTAHKQLNDQETKHTEEISRVSGEIAKLQATLDSCQRHISELETELTSLKGKQKQTTKLSATITDILDKFKRK